MQPLILLAVVSMLVLYMPDHRRLFMLHRAARASDVLITLRLLNSSRALRARKCRWALSEIARVLLRSDDIAGLAADPTPCCALFCDRFRWISLDLPRIRYKGTMHIHPDSF